MQEPITIRLNATFATVFALILILALGITNLVLVLNLRDRVGTHEEVLRQHSPILQQIVTAAQQRQATLTTPSPVGTPRGGEGSGPPLSPPDTQD